MFLLQVTQRRRLVAQNMPLVSAHRMLAHEDRVVARFVRIVHDRVVACGRVHRSECLLTADSLDRGENSEFAENKGSMALVRGVHWIDAGWLSESITSIPTSMKYTTFFLLCLFSAEI